jgi:hypothetical protein
LRLEDVLNGKVADGNGTRVSESLGKCEGNRIFAEGGFRGSSRLRVSR